MKYNILSKKSVVEPVKLHDVSQFSLFALYLHVNNIIIRLIREYTMLSLFLF